MPETVEKMHILVAEQERFIKELMAKEQTSGDDVNRISFHIGFLFGVSAALRRVDVVGMTASDKEQIIDSIKYAAGSIKKRQRKGSNRAKEALCKWQKAFFTKRNGGLPPSAQRGGWALMSSRPGPVITHS